MADENRPFIGYRSAGRRPEAYNDRRASADAPLALLRGVASGVLGAPGDIESLVRMLPGLSEQTFLPTSEDIERRLPLRSVSETPVGRAATGAGQLGGGFYTGPGAPLRAIAGLPSAVSRAGRDFVMAAGQPAVNVVKPKGGNFLAGTIERVVDPMKTRVVGRDPAAQLRDLDASYAQNLEAGTAMNEGAFARERARLEPDIAMNRWLETKLGKYMRNEMATPEDPLRALAERGVLHYDPTPTGYSVSKQRIAAGFPEEGMAQSDLAKRWEKRADTFFNELQASDLTRGYPELVEKDPWLAKVPPETRVYELLGGANEELGMQHLVDELKNAINPTSGLPENLRLKYSDLEKVTVPQAVERVHDINEWRAAQKAEADLARARNPATFTHKEYPEQGLSWVELRQPKELPEGWTQKNSAFYDPTGERHVHPGAEALADALKYEGETMGHCVGRYCPDVVEGRSKIFSLRDKKGQPHVTIEVAPGEGSVYQYLASKNLDLEKEAQKLYPKSSKIASQDLLISDIEATPEYAEWVRSLPQEIVQIKGSGKKDPEQKIRHAGTGYKDNPDAHLLPMIQDFVKSGNWSQVKDAQNAGLRKFTDVFGSGELRMLQEAGAELPNSGWLTGEDIQRLHNMITPEGKRLKYDLMGRIVGGDEASGFAMGGLVHGYQAGGVVKKAAKTIGELAEKYTPEFKQWFAGSKAATPEGEPLRVFRGSARDEGEVLKNSWFTTDPSAASKFSMKGAHMKKNASGKEEYVLPNSVVTPAYLSMKRPLVIDAQGADWNRIPFGDPRDKLFRSTDEIADFARDEKYDGVIFKNVNESDLHVDLDPIDVYATFKPEQVKSTFNKNPTSDPRVGFADGGLVGSNIYNSDAMQDPASAYQFADGGQAGDVRAYADGGLVANSHTADFDPARIDAIVGDLHAMNAG